MEGIRTASRLEGESHALAERVRSGSSRRASAACASSLRSSASASERGHFLRLGPQAFPSLARAGSPSPLRGAGGAEAGSAEKAPRGCWEAQGAHAPLRSPIGGEGAAHAYAEGSPAGAGALAGRSPRTAALAPPRGEDGSLRSGLGAGGGCALSPYCIGATGGAGACGSPTGLSAAGFAAAAQLGADGDRAHSVAAEAGSDAALAERVEPRSARSPRHPDGERL